MIMCIHENREKHKHTEWYCITCAQHISNKQQFLALHNLVSFFRQIVVTLCALSISFSIHLLWKCDGYYFIWYGIRALARFDFILLCAPFYNKIYMCGVRFGAYEYNIFVLMWLACESCWHCFLFFFHLYFFLLFLYIFLFVIFGGFAYHMQRRQQQHRQNDKKIFESTLYLFAW